MNACDANEYKAQQQDGRARIAIEAPSAFRRVARIAFVVALPMFATNPALAQTAGPAAPDIRPMSNVVSMATNASPALCNADCVKANMSKASPGCARQIEAQAPTDFDWLTRPFSTIFQQGDQSSADDSVVRYRGDSIRFLGPQGQWIRVSYECAFDAASQKVLYVNVRPGRLDRAPSPVTRDVNRAPDGRAAPQRANQSKRNLSIANMAIPVDEPSPVEISQVDPHRRHP